MRHARGENDPNNWKKERKTAARDGDGKIAKRGRGRRWHRLDIMRALQLVARDGR